MEVKKLYYKYLDLIRVILCIVVLLYHLNILNGGYLAVCSFFALSGYLSCISTFKKEKFSLFSYYLSRLRKLYLPLIIVVFITIVVTNLFDNIIWLNLKPETTSTLLGYNNFWQLSVNMDYFAHHINSPFMHLWYVSILLQFDLVFPFIYLLLKKIGDKINKIIPCIITIILTVISTIYFYISSNNIMFSYYGTLTRIFSPLFGLSLGFIHIYFGPLILNKLKTKPLNKLIFFGYLLVLILLFYFTKIDIKYFPISMVLTTLVTCRLIDYGVTFITDKLSIFDKIIKVFSSMSYEIYLWQYPLIFLFQYINISKDLILPSIIGILLLLSFILHFAFNNYKKFIVLKIILNIVILSVTSYGLYQYILAKDHTLEMEQLQIQLEKNELEMKIRQQEYELKFKQEQDAYNQKLEELENSEVNLDNFITNLNIVGVGDSVMLGALPSLYSKFPNGYFDAKISRTAWVVGGVLKNLKNKNMLGNPIVLNLGANGDCPKECKKEILNICDNREVFWINVTNDSEVNVNNKLLDLASEYHNLHIVDWKQISSGHPEYFVADGIHLTEIGKKAYVNALYSSIYNFYLKEYETKKNETIKEYEEQLKKGITFYGNDILVNIYDNIKEIFENAHFVIKENYNFEILKSEIQQAIDNKSLTKKIVLTFDNSINITKEEYEEIINLCHNYNVYILSINEENNDYYRKFENVTIIDFSKELKNNKNYLMADKIHLTREGNIALSEFLKKNI